MSGAERRTEEHCARVVGRGGILGGLILMAFLHSMTISMVERMTRKSNDSYTTFAG